MRLCVQVAESIVIEFDFDLGNRMLQQFNFFKLPPTMFKFMSTRFSMRTLYKYSKSVQYQLHYNIFIFVSALSCRCSVCQPLYVCRAWLAKWPFAPTPRTCASGLRSVR